MSDLRSDLAALLTSLRTPSSKLALGDLLHERKNAARYLAALARIAEIVDMTCATKQWDEGICEIQDVLASAAEGGGA